MLCNFCRNIPVTYLIKILNFFNLEYRISFWYFTILCNVCRFIPATLFFLLHSLNWIWNTECCFGTSQCYAMHAQLILSVYSSYFNHWTEFEIQILFLVFHNAMQCMQNYSCLSILHSSITKLILKHKISFWYFTMLCNILHASITKQNLEYRILVVISQCFAMYSELFLSVYSSCFNH